MYMYVNLCTSCLYLLEFIHTNIPHTNYSISKYKPISRAFFKIVEIFFKYQDVKSFEFYSEDLIT